MSQNILRTQSKTGPVEVILGWDRPLQELFCTVLPLSDEDEGDYDVFLLQSGLDSTEDLTALLASVGIEVPALLMQTVALDMANNAGNVMRRFSLNGALEQETVF